MKFAYDAFGRTTAFKILYFTFQMSRCHSKVPKAGPFRPTKNIPKHVKVKAIQAIRPAKRTVKTGPETFGEDMDAAPFEALAEGAVDVVVVEVVEVEFTPEA